MKQNEELTEQYCANSKCNQPINNVISDSQEKSIGQLNMSLAENSTPVEVPNSNKLLLFTTKTCPNCKMIEKMLDAQNIQYEIIDAEEEKNRELVKKYNIMQAPTMVYLHDETADVYHNASNIMKFVQTAARS